MADLPVGVTDNAPGAGIAEVDTRLVVGGSTVQQRVVPVDAIVCDAAVCLSIAGIGGRSSVAASIGPNNLFAVWNGSPSQMMELARVHVEYAPAFASMAPSLAAPNQGPVMAVAYKITSKPSHGVEITAAKITKHPSQVSAASIVALTDGQARVHGTVAASALIASLGANSSAPLGQAALPRIFGYPSSNFGPNQVLSPDQILIGDRDAIYPVIIGPGQGFVVRLENLASPVFANPSTAVYAAEVAWREYNPANS